MAFAFVASLKLICRPRRLHHPAVPVGMVPVVALYVDKEAGCFFVSKIWRPTIMEHSANEIRVCVDVGSQEHYVAIGLSTGERLDEFSLAHTPEGISGFFRKLKSFEKKHSLPVVVAMEGYNGYARPIDSQVLVHGYKLFNVNNLKLARFKEIFPAPAKTDPIDAWKIFELFSMKDTLPMAKNALQEVGAIPEENQKLKRLTRRRRSLVKEKVQTLNRLFADLLAVCPGLTSLTRTIENLWFLRFLTARDDIRKLVRIQRKSLVKIKGVGKKYVDVITNWQKTAEFSVEAEWVGSMIVRDANRILELLSEIAALDTTIERLSTNSEIAMRLCSIPGFGPISSGELAGEIGNIERFQTEASLALYLGMAVLDKSSGKHTGTRQSRSVNTRAKAAMMAGVAHLIRSDNEAKAYYEKKRTEGKKHNQAVRALGRHIVRVIWSMLKQARDYEIRAKEVVKVEKDQIVEDPKERLPHGTTNSGAPKAQKNCREPSEKDPTALQIRVVV